MRLKATYSFPNTVKLFMLAMGILLGTLRGSAQISVTATAGTLGPTAYTQLRLAFAAINAGTHQGVINISVTGSTTETGIGTLNQSGSGAANYTSILIKPAPGVTATIASNIATNGPIYFYGSANVTIDGSNIVGGTTQNLTITNTNGTGGYYIRIGSPSAASGASNITVENCIFSGLGSGSGIGITSGSGTTLYGQGEATNNNITIQNNSITGAQLAIYGYGPAAMDGGWNVAGNAVSGGGFGGIQINYGQNFNIDNNIVTGLTANYGFPITGITVSFVVANCNIFDNQVTGIANLSAAGAYGIYFDLDPSVNVNCFNNYISNITARTSGVVANNGFGIYMDYGSGVNLLENSINQSVNEPGAAAHVTAGICFDPFIAGGILTGGVNVIDNISVNSETTGTSYSIYSVSPNTIFASINYNDYYTPTSNLGFIGGAARTSIAAMQTGFGGNLNSITMNPTWVSTTNLDLQLVPANTPLNAGLFTVPVIGADIHGTPRVSPTIGAYELILCPPAITGAPTTICTGATTNLTDAVTGGTWSSTVPGVATVSGTGVVTGVAGGTTTISYTIGTCAVTQVISVNPLTPILGTTVLCLGSTTTLTDATAPGTWSSSIPGVATIVTGSGFLNAVGIGTTTITYTTSLGCPTTTVVTVTPTPSAILGNRNVCSGSTTTLSDLVAGGGWLSSNPAVASIGGASGIVSGSGIVTATSVITYTLGSCSVTATVTVNPSPAVISGTPNVCSGLTVTVSDAVAGGTWSSSNTGVATISGTGVITGVGAGGTAVITYMMPGNCYATIIATVNPAPSSILGNPVVCQGLTTSLSNLVGGGAWSSSTTSVATIDPVTGLVTGVGPGTSTIQYISTNCNPVTVVVTVNPVQPILGTPVVCAGLSITLSDMVPGGTWSSSLTSVATVVPGTGFVNGVSAGNSTIVYTTPANCTTSVILTVNPSPVAITGTTSLCLGQVAIMSDGTLGGTWSSSNTSVATIVPGSGFTSAVGTGTTSIIYTLPAGCTATMTLSVNPLPGAINGNTQVCAGLTDDLTDVTGGGSWSSSNTTAAIIDPATGIVNAISAGITTITYLLPTGCSATMVLTVNPSPVAITGNFNLCVGLSNQLTDGSAGGTWSSSNSAIASIIPATGVATGVATGTATITYTLSAGCTATSNVTVYPVPGAINGATSGCIGNTTTLTDGTGGGTWSSSATGVATIGITTGLVTAVTAGTTTITYSLISTGCYASTVFTVNPPPAAISGTANICQGSSVAFTDGTGGGNWSSSNATIASVSTTGLVTGVLPGTVNISYTLPTTCYSIFSTTIEAAPTAINGSGTVCVGSAVTLTDAVTGGSWSIASGSGTAAISSASGIVTGLTPGTVIVTYATCSPVSTVMSVNPLPTAILGEGSVCEGSSTTVSDATPGGTWSISSGASISSSGVITGISTAGAVIVTYTLPTSCFITVPISVSPIPSPIQGVDSVCPGSSVILTDATADGVWSSSDGTIAHATAFTGEILGMVHGDVTITYSLVSGCYTVTPFHVETPIPVFLTVTTNPIDTFLCTNVPVTLTAVVTPAVGAPTFKWEIFGSYVGVGNTYTYNPLHADFITCLMTMNGACTSPSAINKDVTLNVWPLAGPIVVVTCTQPDTAAYLGEVYTFYTTVTFGGPNPSYQWYINNAPVGGATHPVFTTPIYNENDSIYCVVNGNSPCDTGSYVGTSNGKIIYGQSWLSVNNVKTGSNDLSLFPNPNTGSFTLSGTVSAGQDKEVTLEVTDMLGRTVYTGKTIPQNGSVKAEIKLDNEAAGSYLLRASTESGIQTFHFVIQ